jgi:Zn-finger nucleic acid-binding protein
MNDMSCPWCEVPLELTVDQNEEQQCPECLTSWRYEDRYEAELALAA